MDPRENKASFLMSLGICLVIFGFLSSVTWFWLPDKSFHLIPSGSYTLIPFAILATVSLALAGFNLKKLQFKPEAFAWVLVLVFFSDWMCIRYNFFQAPTIRGELILGSILTYFILKRRAFWIFRVLPILAIILLITNFIIESQGNVIFSDDHATFFYRLTLLKDNFPYIPFFYPLWNGGIDARAFFATGSLNLFFLSYPFLLFFPPEKIFNFIIIGVLFLLVPGTTYLAAKIEKFSREECAIAVLLSLSSSFLWYRWALSYGTMGFIIATTLLPLNLVLASKIISKTDNLKLLEVLLFILTFTMMLFWSLSGIVFIPLIVLALFSIRSLLRKKYIPTIIISLLVLNIPWVMLFWSASNVSTFLVSESEQVQTADTQASQPVKNQMPEFNGQKGTYDKFLKQRYKHRAGGLDLAKATELLRKNAHRANPLLVFLALPGLFLLTRRSKLPFLITCGWLLILGSLVVPFKPQLELDRMLVILTLVLCLPCARALSKVLSSGSQARRLLYMLPALLAGGYLLTGPLSSAALVRNRGLTQYKFMGQGTKDFIAKLKAIETEGRILFSGCILHELNDGHLAPLTYYTGKSFIASGYVHNLWSYTRVIPPEYYTKGVEGFEEYFDYYNVTLVIAYEGYLIKFFKDHPDHYELVWDEDFSWPAGSLQLYRRTKASNSYFLEGEGELIEQGTNSITVSLESKEAVLKFNYFPFLNSSDCKLNAKKISDSMTLVKLSECPIGKPIRIYSVSPFERLSL